MNSRLVAVVPFSTALIFLLYYLFISPLFLYHNDIGWHLAAGDLIRSTGIIPRTDPWSFTASGSPWYLLSWLWDVLISYVYARAGFIPLLIATAAAGSAILWLQATTAVRNGVGWIPFVIVFLIGGMGFPQFSPPDVFLSISPQVVTLLFITLFQFLLLRSERINSSKVTAIGLTALLLLWSNMHGGFVLGIVIVATFAAHALVLGRTQNAAWLGAVCLFSILLIGVANPLGWHIFHTVLGLLTSDSQRGITEWQPVWERFSGGLASPAIAYLLLFPFALIGLLRSGRFLLPVLALALPLYVMAWLQIRYISIFIVWSLPLVAFGLSQLSGRLSPIVNLRFRTITALTLFLVTAVLCRAILHSQFPYEPELPRVNWPKEEIAYLEAYHPDKNLFHPWNYGSFIIFQARGGLKPFIDGRAGSAYPLSLFENYNRFFQTRDWTEIIKTYNIRAILWPKNENRLLPYFDASQGWEKAFEGTLAVVYVKQP
jgi:hypothetical protein